MPKYKQPAILSTKTVSVVTVTAIVLVIVGLGLISYAAGLLPGVKFIKPNLRISVSSVSESGTASSVSANAFLVSTVNITNDGKRDVGDTFEFTFTPPGPSWLDYENLEWESGAVFAGHTGATSNPFYSDVVGYKYSCSVSSNVYTCRLDAMDVGEIRTFVFVGYAPGTALSCGTTKDVALAARVDTGKVIAEQNESDNFGSENIALVMEECMYPDLRVDISSTSESGAASSASANEFLVSTVTITNDSEWISDDFEFTFTPPGSSWLDYENLEWESGAVFAGHTGATSNPFYSDVVGYKYSCSVSSNVYTCRLDAMDVGEIRTFVFVGYAPGTALSCGTTKDVTMAARVDSGRSIQETDETNNYASESIILQMEEC